MRRSWDDQIKRSEIGERLVRRNPVYYQPLHRQLVWLEQAKLDERKAWADARLREVLRVAAKTRYGRSIGGTEDLASWPLLDRTHVREHAEAFQSGNSWFAVQASGAIEEDAGPLRLIRSPESIVAEQVALDRLVFALGADPMSARTAVLRGDEVSDEPEAEDALWRYSLGGRRLVLSSRHLSDDTLSNYAHELREFSPDILWAYPSSLELLCRLLQSSGEQLRIPRVMTSSEPLTPSAWLLARQVLGCKLVDYYGQVERVAFAAAHAPTQYLFMPGYSYVELILHSQDGAAPAYEIVGTTLWNLAMPLIRYRTGDLVRLPRRYGEQQREQIAWGMLAFEGVAGRDVDVLLAPDGRHLLSGLDHILHEVDHVVRAQLVQDALDRVVIRVKPGQGFGSNDAQRLERNARNKIPRSIDVRIEVTDMLERTQQGKTPFVVHRPAVREILKQFGLEPRAGR